MDLKVFLNNRNNPKKCKKNPALDKENVWFR